MRCHGPLLCAFCLCFHFKQRSFNIIIDTFELPQQLFGFKKQFDIQLAYNYIVACLVNLMQHLIEFHNKPEAVNSAQNIRIMHKLPNYS